MKRISSFIFATSTLIALSSYGFCGIPTEAPKTCRELDKEKACKAIKSCTWIPGFRLDNKIYKAYCENKRCMRQETEEDCDFKVKGCRWEEDAYTGTGSCTER